jgi:hypothetical protein
MLPQSCTYQSFPAVLLEFGYVGSLGRTPARARSSRGWSTLAKNISTPSKAYSCQMDTSNSVFPTTDPSLSRYLHKYREKKLQNQTPSHEASNKYQEQNSGIKKTIEITPIINVRIINKKRTKDLIIIRYHPPSPMQKNDKK